MKKKASQKHEVNFWRSNRVFLAVYLQRFKKKLGEEKRLLRLMKTMSAQEIETKNMLEKILRQCVDDVKAEIAKKRSENKSVYYARGRKGKAELQEENRKKKKRKEK